MTDLEETQSWHAIFSNGEPPFRGVIKANVELSCLVCTLLILLRMDVEHTARKKVPTSLETKWQEQGELVASVLGDPLCNYTKY